MSSSLSRHPCRSDCSPFGRARYALVLPTQKSGKFRLSPLSSNGIAYSAIGGLRTRIRSGGVHSFGELQFQLFFKSLYLWRAGLERTSSRAYDEAAWGRGWRREAEHIRISPFEREFAVSDDRHRPTVLRLAEELRLRDRDLNTLPRTVCRPSQRLAQTPG